METYNDFMNEFFRVRNAAWRNKGIQPNGFLINPVTADLFRELVFSEMLSPPTDSGELKVFDIKLYRTFDLKEGEIKAIWID